MDAEGGMAGGDIDVSAPIGIVGAGVMGAGIAQVAAVAGHPVRLQDVRSGAARAAVDGVREQIAKLVAKGRLGVEQGKRAAQSISAVESMDQLGDCGLVIEAVAEDLAAKRAVFCEVEAVLRPDALLATNTSSISVTAIGAGLKRPGRLAGLHFFNPAPVMPLVEVILGAGTRPEVARTLHSLARRWGKVPVLARSSPGFIVNRVARPFYAEALRVVSEGAADCATVDAVMRESGGFRMGPFELMDLIGNDVNYAVTRSVFDGFYGDSRFTPSLLQLEMVQAGLLGRKTGRGFYEYGEGALPHKPATRPGTAAPTGGRVYAGTGLAQRLAKAGWRVEHEVHPDGRVAEAEDFVLYRSDGRTATARAAASGVRNTVLIDLELDPAKSTRVAVAAAEQCDAGGQDGVVGLLQAAGLAVSSIGDVPGMIVLRTVAMLANEAADAVNQGVCSAVDCDLAMRTGVNYPRGPLEWAEALGLQEMVTTLDHMRAAYGEERYRVSPLLRRKALAGGRFAESGQAAVVDGGAEGGKP